MDENTDELRLLLNAQQAASKALDTLRTNLKKTPQDKRKRENLTISQTRADEIFKEFNDRDAIIRKHPLISEGYAGKSDAVKAVYEDIKKFIELNMPKTKPTTEAKTELPLTATTTTTAATTATTAGSATTTTVPSLMITTSASVTTQASVAVSTVIDAYTGINSAAETNATETTATTYSGNMPITTPVETGRSQGELQMPNMYVSQPQQFIGQPIAYVGPNGQLMNQHQQMFMQPQQMYMQPSPFGGQANQANNQHQNMFIQPPTGMAQNGNQPQQGGAPIQLQPVVLQPMAAGEQSQWMHGPQQQMHDQTTANNLQTGQFAPQPNMWNQNQNMTTPMMPLYAQPQGKIEMLLEKLMDSSLENEHSNQRGSGLRIPEIQIPVFSGDVRDFKSFRNVFEYVISNSRTTKIERFHLLRSRLAGAALAEVNTLYINDSNYDSAWDLLRQRYDNPRVIIETNFNALQDHPPTKAKDGGSILRLIQCCKGVVHNIATSHENPNYSDLMYINLILQKLDDYTKARFEDFFNDILSQTNDVSNRMPTIAEVTTFLEREYRKFAIYESNTTIIQPPKHSASGGKE